MNVDDVKRMGKMHRKRMQRYWRRATFCGAKVKYSNGLKTRKCIHFLQEAMSCLIVPFIESRSSTQVSTRIFLDLHVYSFVKPI